jgi:hypothetical protein
VSARISIIIVASGATLGIRQSINRTLHVGLEFAKTIRFQARGVLPRESRRQCLLTIAK